MTYNIIATGSKGNAVLLDGSLLIDCGVPYKKLEPYVNDIDLVLLTHIHSDHFNKATIRKLAKKRPLLRFACGGWLVGYLAVECGVNLNAIDIDGGCYGELIVGIEETTHDVPNCAWKIMLLNRERAFYATDTGTLDGIEAKDYDLYLVEANHKTEEIEKRATEKLERGEFSYEHRAAANHLSYEQAMDWLAENIGANGQYVLLHGHAEEKEEQ